MEDYNKPFNRSLGDLYVKDYLGVFPLQKEDISFNCTDCHRKAYSKLVWHFKKINMKKFEFTGKQGKIYNFPSLRIYGVTAENITDATAQKLFEAKSQFVKEVKKEK